MKQKIRKPHRTIAEGLSLPVEVPNLLREITVRRFKADEKMVRWLMRRK